MGGGVSLFTQTLKGKVSWRCWGVVVSATERLVLKSKLFFKAFRSQFSEAWVKQVGGGLNKDLISSCTWETAWFLEVLYPHLRNDWLISLQKPFALCNCLWSLILGCRWCESLFSGKEKFFFSPSVLHNSTEITLREKSDLQFSKTIPVCSALLYPASPMEHCWYGGGECPMSWGMLAGVSRTLHFLVHGQDCRSLFLCPQNSAVL